MAAALWMMQGMTTVSAGMGEVDYSGLPNKNTRLHWEAVGTVPQERPAENKQAQAPKAIPVIITAADIEAQKKAGKKLPAEPVPQQPAPVPVQQPAPAPKPQPVVPAVKPAENTVELPPIQPIAASPQLPAKPVKADKVVELPPIEKVPAAVSQGKKDEAKEKQSVELPPIQPVR